ncbi:MAG: hypothetical protein PHF97_11430 [Bacteroidales bacterium]|nr:hypothetical protein [Bacteroidales bacterium]MDD4604401.1 hypothetical protein [Bacteroidales bacterium]
MKSKTIDFKKLASDLEDLCPFIYFAVLTGMEPEDQIGGMIFPELMVFVEPEMGSCDALEHIFPVLVEIVSDVFCDVTLLNRVDPVSRFKATNGNLLFIREGREATYRRFVERAKLDYKIYRALLRKQGLIM